MNEDGRSQAGGADDDDFTLEESDLREKPPSALRALWRASDIAGRGLTSRQRALRVAVSAGSVLLALTILLAGFYGMRPRLHLFESTPPAPRVILTAHADLNDVTDAVWSPDGRLIAVLGSQNGSGYTGLEREPPPSVVIFDARTGSVQRSYSLDSEIYPALINALGQDLVLGASPAGISDGNLLVFSSLQWSPNGREIAVPFYYVVRPISRDILINGLALADTRGPHVRVLIQRQMSPQQRFRGWDVAAGRMIQLSPNSGDTLSLGFAYTWAKGDQLTPTNFVSAALPPRAESLSPIGNADGGRSFSIWQPGRLVPVSDISEGPGQANYSWQPTILTWSPDGLVLSMLGPSPVSVLPRATAAGPAPAKPTYAVIRARDAAMDALLTTPPAQAQNGWQLAWRPDGSELAVYGPIVREPSSVSIRSTRTGDSLASLTLPRVAPKDQTQSGTIALLRWSPDGTHLLFFSSLFGALYVWGPATLPQG